MWNFKRCPRCRGDVYIDEDLDTCYEKCLQCGYERELQRAAAIRKNPCTTQEKSGIL
jgi:hypothetical protein